MDTSKHTITIPIADYNALMKAQEYAGAKLLTEDTPLYKAILHAIEEQAYRNGRPVGDPVHNPLAHFQLFIKEIKR